MKSKKASKESAKSKDATKALKEPAPQENLMADWQSKLRYHRNTWIIIAVVVIFALITTSISIISKQKRGEESWYVLGEVAGSTGVEQALAADIYQMKDELQQKLGIHPQTSFRDEAFSPEFKIKDLKEPARKFLYAVLGDTKGLPEGAIGTRVEPLGESLVMPIPGPRIENLDEVRLRYLPASLTQRALRIHNIERLERQLPDARKTSAEPWICYTLAHLHSWDNPGKALSYYRALETEYPDFLVKFPHVGQGTLIFERENVQRDALWALKHLAAAKFELREDTQGKVEAVLTTTRGKVQIILFQSEFPIAADQFIALANDGFFDALNFYRVDEDAVCTGCPLGNGLGEPKRTVQEKTQDIWARRGLILMDNLGKPGKIGSRFFIIKKFSPLTEQYAVLGKVSQGMEVVDELTKEDLLLSVTIAHGYP